MTRVQKSPTGTKDQAHQIHIRPLTSDDSEWVTNFAREHWGSEKIVIQGEIFFITCLPGFIIEMDGKAAGMVTYKITQGNCEIITFDSLHPGLGIGTSLIIAVTKEALRSGCRRLFLSTTNDNIDALLFYQKRGFVLTALRPGAVIASRKLKPEIPEFGNYGLPIRDEIELEMDLSMRSPSIP